MMKFLLMTIALFLVIIIAFFSFNLYKTYCTENYFDNELTTYTENQLSKYEGGDKAEDFFPKYLEIADKNEIFFQYCDNTMKSNYLHKFYSYFCLDIVFDDSNYLTHIKNLKNVDSNRYEVSHFTVLMEKFENDNCKAILCNDKTKTVRYLLFYGDFKDYNLNIGISPIIHWNMSLNQQDGSLVLTK